MIRLTVRHDSQNNDTQHNDIQHNKYKAWHSAWWHWIQSVAMLRVIIQNVIMLSVIIQNVILLNVVAPSGREAPHLLLLSKMDETLVQTGNGMESHEQMFQL